MTIPTFEANIVVDLESMSPDHFSRDISKKH